MKLRVDPDLFNESYVPYVLSRYRYEIYYGGRGSGKSNFVAQKLVLRCLKNEYFRCVYSRKQHEHIRDSQFFLLKKTIREFGLLHMFRILESTMMIECLNGNTFIAKGVDNAEKTKGVDEVTHLWFDEVTEVEETDFNTLDNALRGEKTDLQTIITFNPVLDTHWVRVKFFSDDDKHKVNEAFQGVTMALRTTYKDNKFIDREAYAAQLVRNAAGNINRIRVDLDGDWGLEINEDPWLYAYDDTKHSKDIRFNPSFPVHLSFDFNRDPMSCTAWQMSNSIGTTASFLHCIAEFTGVLGLENLCRKIKGRYPNSILFVTGDCNGNSKYHAHVLQYNASDESTYEGKNDTNYRIIQRTLNINEKQMHTFTKNMEHSDSRQLCNVVFHNHPNVFIDSSCVQVRTECQIATVDEKSAKASHLKKDREGYKMDLFDTVRYLLQYYYKKYPDMILPKKIQNVS